MVSISFRCFKYFTLFQLTSIPPNLNISTLQISVYPSAKCSVKLFVSTTYSTLLSYVDHSNVDMGNVLNFAGLSRKLFKNLEKIFRRNEKLNRREFHGFHSIWWCDSSSCWCLHGCRFPASELLLCAEQKDWPVFYELLVCWTTAVHRRTLHVGFNGNIWSNQWVAESVCCSQFLDIHKY